MISFENNVTGVILPIQGHSAIGSKNIYGEPVSFVGYFERSGGKTTNTHGDTVVLSGLLMLKPSVSVSENDKVTIDNRSYIAAKIERCTLFGKPHHNEILLQETVR